MDKTYSNLMDIVSRTKKIDDKNGKKPHPRPIPRIEVEEDFIEEVVEEVVEEKPVRKTVPKKSLVENSAIGNFLNKPKKATTKSKAAKKSDEEKETKKTTKKASTKSSTKAKTTTKKTSEDTLEKLKSIKSTKKPSTPTASNIDLKDPKNAELYNALHNTLFSGGTDISEYMTTDQPEDNNLNAEMLKELKVKQEAKRINQEITKEQQEYEQLFTGSFSSFGEVQQEEEEIQEETDAADDSEKLREYFANIEKASAENNQNIGAGQNYDTSAQDTDQKIAEYYRRKQEKIEQEARITEEDNTPKYTEYETRQNEYEAIFNGPVMSRKELEKEETEEVEDNQEQPQIEAEDNIQAEVLENKDDTLDNEDIEKLSLDDIYKTITDRFNISDTEIKTENQVEETISNVIKEQIQEEITEEIIETDVDRANRIVDELKDEEISDEVSELEALTDEELENYIVSSNVPEIEAQAKYSEEDNEIVLNDLNTAFSIFAENLKQNEQPVVTEKTFDEYEFNKEAVNESKEPEEEIHEELESSEIIDIEEESVTNESQNETLDIFARAKEETEQNIETEDIEDLEDADDFIEVQKLDLESIEDDNEDDDEVMEEDIQDQDYKTDDEEIDTDEELDDDEELEDDEESDTISKQEFYNEMARLQENLLSELRGEKVNTASVDLFEEEPKTQLIAEEKVEDIEPKQTLQDKEEEIGDYAKKLVDKIIENIDNKNKEEEKQKQDPIVLKIQVEGQTNQAQTSTQPVVAESVVEKNEEVSKVEENQEQLIDTLEEPVKTAEEVLEELDRDSLLNSDIALNDSDLEFEEKSTAPKEVTEDDYFYLSPEDNEKKTLPQDEYMQMYKEEVSGTNEKEVGDINLNKDIQNAIPSSKAVLEQSNIDTNEKEDSIETIYTLFGMERKKVKKNVEQDLKILYVASECQPFIATGGLADVAGSLPKSIAKNSGIDIRVMLPLYGEIKDEYREKFEYIGNFTVHLSWRQEYCGLFRYYDQGVTYYFVDNERYFKRNKAYGFYDDGERFAYFCKAVVESLPMINFFPDIIHCNDWQTALVSSYIKTGTWSDHRYYSIKNLYTIHNVEYQGVYGMENLKDLFGIDARFRNDMDYNGDINLTKAAIQFSDKFTTVSNSYCDNLKQPYCSRGLHHIIIRNEYKLSGIVNGIDLDFYNPAMDTCLYKNFDIHSIDEKVMNKKIWQDELGLPVDGDTPLLAIVSRLVSHKGLDLVSKMMESVLAEDVQLVVVGTGDQRFIDYFKYLEEKYPTKVRALVDKYSNDLARKAYGASDIFLMPSKIEPCGISQMIASRYGSVPIVREVGGLKDTITDFGCVGGGNGYTFANYNPNDLLYQVNRALNDYKDKAGWRKKMETCMSIDFSWDKSAVKYIELYRSLMKY